MLVSVSPRNDVRRYDGRRERGVEVKEGGIVRRYDGEIYFVRMHNISMLLELIATAP